LPELSAESQESLIYGRVGRGTRQLLPLMWCRVSITDDFDGQRLVGPGVGCMGKPDARRQHHTAPVGLDPDRSFKFPEHARRRNRVHQSHRFQVIRREAQEFGSATGVKDLSAARMREECCLTSTGLNPPRWQRAIKSFCEDGLLRDGLAGSRHAACENDEQTARSKQVIPTTTGDRSGPVAHRAGRRVFPVACGLCAGLTSTN
jgi:hypothetical protein